MGNILNKTKFCSSIELKAKDISLKKLKKLIQKDLGDSFIKDFKEQMPFLYKMVNTEKIAVYLIFFTYCYCDYDNPGGLNDYIYFTKKKICLF